jgi:putative tricarboxylic transport membrane protein
VRNNDFESSLFCLILGLVFITGGLRMGLGPLNAPGPGFFPAVIGGILSSLSAVLFVTASRRKGPSEKTRVFKKGSWGKILPCLLSLIFYLAFLDYLGYILTTTLFIFFLLKVVGRKRWGPSILMAVVVSVSSYALFRMGLGVLLPKGFIHW